MTRWGMPAAIGGALVGLLAAAPASRAANDTIKVGYVDPFSGPFAAGGDQFLKVFQYIVAYVNEHSPPMGRKFELVAFDDKLQPSEALIALKTITDQNMPFVMQCTGSNVGAALIDGVAKHNARNPDRRVIYLNCGALATELTNEKCDFWQFRFTGNVEQRALARIKSLPPDLKKVYLLNQDYLFGQSIQASTRKYLAQLRPDIQIVGDELVPFGKVKDFSPYVTKIKASGAQSIITGNYGPDLNLLIKAGIEAGLDARYDTYLGNLVGNATAIGKNGDGRMTAVYEYNENIAVEEKNQAAEAFDQGFRAKNDFDFDYTPYLTMFEMVSAAISKAQSADPMKVALALEGMEHKDLLGEPNTMRAADHQLIDPFYAGVFTHGVKYDTEHTGLGWKTTAKFPASEMALPTTCKMKRPTS